MSETREIRELTPDEADLVAGGIRPTGQETTPKQQPAPVVIAIIAILIG